MDQVDIQLLAQAAIAMGIGLLVGLEREHHEIEERPPGSPAAGPTLLGVRTFTLLCLLGWLSALSAEDQPWFPATAFLVVGALVTWTAIRERDRPAGLTTEIAALMTLGLGMLVHKNRGLAVALGLATTLLLVSKPWFRTLIPRMRRMDFTATLQLLVLFAIVLPLLPNTAQDPWGVLAPRRIGVFVALVASIGYVGYVLHRLLGPRRGAGLTGLVGGLVSSTAVTVAMTNQVRSAPAQAGPARLAVLLASTVMFGRVLVVCGVVSLPVAEALAIPMLAMAVVTLVASLLTWRGIRTEAANDDGDQPGRADQPGGGAESADQPPISDLTLPNPFSLVPALKWGFMFAVILVGIALLRDAFGQAGVMVGAALSGLLDVDAVTLATTRQAATGALAPHVAGVAITIAVVSNMLVKGGISLTGGRRFGRPIGVAFGGSVLCGLATAALIALF